MLPSYAVIPHTIFEDSRLSKTSLRVYLALARHARKESPEVWPSIRLLSEVLTITKPRVREGIKNLIECGHVSDTGKRTARGVHVYKMSWTAPETDKPTSTFEIRNSTTPPADPIPYRGTEPVSGGGIELVPPIRTEERTDQRPTTTARLKPKRDEPEQIVDRSSSFSLSNFRIPPSLDYLNVPYDRVLKGLKDDQEKQLVIDEWAGAIINNGSNIRNPIAYLHSLTALQKKDQLVPSHSQLIQNQRQQKELDQQAQAEEERLIAKSEKAASEKIAAFKTAVATIPQEILEKLQKDFLQELLNKDDFHSDRIRKGGLTKSFTFRQLFRGRLEKHLSENTGTC
jgi:hypothetical protein